MLLSTEDFKRLKQILDIPVNRGANPRLIISKLQQALTGSYEARGRYSERDLDVAYLVKSMGGPRLLYALSTFYGMASYRTVSRQQEVPRVYPSTAAPRETDVEKNIKAFFSDAQRPLPSQSGQTLMLDGVALEEKCRYYSEENEIVGVCREHAHMIDRKVLSLEMVERAATALNGEHPTCHYAKEATVAAIAPHSMENYNAVPIAVSGSCKKEKGMECAVWIDAIVRAWEKHGEEKHGGIWTIASDGESTFRVAKFILCMDRDLDQTSELGKALSPLAGLNTRTGRNNVTMSADWKYALKREVYLTVSKPRT